MTRCVSGDVFNKYLLSIWLVWLRGECDPDLEQQTLVVVVVLSLSLPKFKFYFNTASTVYSNHKQPVTPLYYHSDAYAR